MSIIKHARGRAAAAIAEHGLLSANGRSALQRLAQSVTRACGYPHDRRPLIEDAIGELFVELMRREHGLSFDGRSRRELKRKNGAPVVRKAIARQSPEFVVDLLANIASQLCDRVGVDSRATYLLAQGAIEAEASAENQTTLYQLGSHARVKDFDRAYWPSTKRSSSDEDEWRSPSWIDVALNDMHPSIDNRSGVLII